MCMWKWAGSAQTGQARLWRPNGHQWAKSHAGWQSPSLRTEELRTFSKNVFIFRTLLGPPGCFLRFSRCWPYFVAGTLLGGSGRVLAVFKSTVSEHHSSSTLLLCGDSMWLAVCANQQYSKLPRQHILEPMTSNSGPHRHSLTFSSSLRRSLTYLRRASDVLRLQRSPWLPH